MNILGFIDYVLLFIIDRGGEDVLRDILAGMVLKGGEEITLGLGNIIRYYPLLTTLKSIH
jgi:hypothetical protein